MRILTALGLTLAIATGCSLTTSDRDLDPIERAQLIHKHAKSGDTTLKQYAAQNQDLKRPGNYELALEFLESARADFQRAVDLDVAGGGQPSAIPRQGLAKAEYMLATVQRVQLDSLNKKIAALEERGRPISASLSNERDAAYELTIQYTDSAIRTLDYYERVLHRGAPWPSCSLLLADCYEIKNEWEAAAESLERFLANNPVGPKTQQQQERRIRAMRQKAFERVDEGF